MAMGNIPCVAEKTQLTETKSTETPKACNDVLSLGLFIEHMMRIRSQVTLDMTAATLSIFNHRDTERQRDGLQLRSLQNMIELVAE